MEDNNSLLLQRVAVLRRHLQQENNTPDPQLLDDIFIELERAIEQARSEAAALQRDKTNLARQNEALARKNETLVLQNELLERNKQNLERYSKTLERHNTSLLRQNSQIERHNAAILEKSAAIETGRRRYQDLFEYAPVAYLITDSGGVIQEANRAAAEMLNASRLEMKGESILNFILARDHKIITALLSRVRRVQDVDLCLQPRGKGSLEAALTLSTFYDETGQPETMLWLLRDVSERHRAMQALNASERRFRTIFNEANLGIVLVDLQNRIVRANRAFQEMLGYGEEELAGRPVSELACSEDVPVGQAVLALEEHRQNTLTLETRFRRRDGQYIWTSLSLSMLRGAAGQPEYAIAMVQNISAEKQAAIELAEMRRRLLESGEMERLRLAQELHDGPMQDLYGAVFRLTNFSDQTSDPRMLKNLSELQELVKTVANRLRDIVGELRPTTIGHLGLERAIRSHAERLAEAHPELEIKLHLSRDAQALPAHTRLALFRIYQQCMANILHHAQASQALVAFHLDDGDATLEVWDNGRGFTLPAKWVDLLRQGRYGLAGIAERVQALGGTLKIDTQPGAGTLVHVVAPVNPG